VAILILHLFAKPPALEGKAAAATTTTGAMSAFIVPLSLQKEDVWTIKKRG
jgi:hypothetical protein